MEVVVKLTDYFIHNIQFYWYGNIYTGSHKGMRYSIQRFPCVNLYSREGESQRDDPNARLLCYIWPEPFCRKATDPNLVMSKEFSFDSDGLTLLHDWINEQYNNGNWDANWRY